MTESNEVHFVSALERIADGTTLPTLPAEYLSITVPAGLVCRRVWAAWWCRASDTSYSKDNKWRVRGWRGNVEVVNLPGASHDNSNAAVTPSGMPKSHLVSLWPMPYRGWLYPAHARHPLQVVYNPNEWQGVSHCVWLEPVEFEASITKLTWDLVWHHGGTNSLDTYIFLACQSWPKAKP